MGEPHEDIADSPPLSDCEASGFIPQQLRHRDGSLPQVQRSGRLRTERPIPDHEGRYTDSMRPPPGAGGVEEGGGAGMAALSCKSTVFGCNDVT